MSTTVVIISKDISRKCNELISSSQVTDVQKGVEMLLQNNLYIDGEAKPLRADQIDASTMLARGLATLSKSPFESENCLLPLPTKYFVSF
jgi:hypothetical protein